MTDAQSTESTPDRSADKLSFASKAIYGTGELGISIAESAITFFLLFYYVHVVHLDSLLVGVALGIGRFWDAVTDPLMGYISDHTRSRWGRRRPHLVFGAVPFGLLFFAIWCPFVGVTGNAAFLYLLASFLAFSTAATVCQVPYYTLGGEMSADYHERSSIISIRQIFAAIGLLIGSGFTRKIVILLGGVPYGEPESRKGWLLTVALFGAIGTAAWFATGMGARERGRPQAAGPQFDSLWQVPGGAFRAAARTLRNPHFRIIAGVFVIVQVAFTMTTSILPFLLKAWMLKPHAMMPIMVTLILTLLPCLAIWVRISHRLGKRTSYIAGLVILGVMPFQSWWMFGPDMWDGYIYIYPFLFAIGLASHYVFPWSLMPDIIDYDELTTGTRQDGPYFGVMTFLRKSSAALSVLIAGGLIKFIGYDENIPQQLDETLLGLRVIYAVIPSLGFLGGVILFLRFPLTEARSSEIRSELTARRRAQEAESAPGA